MSRSQKNSIHGNSSIFCGGEKRWNCRKFEEEGCFKYVWCRFRTWKTSVKTYKAPQKTLHGSKIHCVIDQGSLVCVLCGATATYDFEVRKLMVEIAIFLVSIVISYVKAFESYFTPEDAQNLPLLRTLGAVVIFEKQLGLFLIISTVEDAAKLLRKTENSLFFFLWKTQKKTQA